MAMYSQFRPYDSFVMAPPMFEPPRRQPLPEIGLKISLPTQQYKPFKQTKTIPIPFDPRMCNDGMFDSLTKAMVFIAKHCAYHHQQFNRSVVKLYLPFCRVLNFGKGGYVVPMHLSKREFDSAYNVAAKTAATGR